MPREMCSHVPKSQYFSADSISRYRDCDSKTHVNCLSPHRRLVTGPNRQDIRAEILKGDLNLPLCLRPFTKYDHLAALFATDIVDEVDQVADFGRIIQCGACKLIASAWRVVFDVVPSPGPVH